MKTERDTKGSERPSYFLTTKRLALRTWTEADEPLALALWGDAEGTKLVGGPLSPDDVHARLKREIAIQHSQHYQYWPVFRLDGAGLVGCCGLRPYKPSAKVHELGFQIRREHWGNGYATEAATAVIAHAFGPLGAAALFAGHHPENATSRHVLAKLGFEYTHDEFYAPTRLMHPSYILTVERWRESAG